MIVLIDGLVGVEYRVFFTHVQTGGHKSSKLSNPATEEPLVRLTECKILEKVDGKEDLCFVSIGYSRCHPDDNFDKETGRQLSLKKALIDGDFTKETRKQFWDVYRNWGKERF